MKKIFLIILLFAFVFCVAGKISAMTDPERRALIAQIQQQLIQLEQQLAQMLAQQQGTQTWCYTFNNNLGFANSGSIEVLNLHMALQREGISYSPDNISTYYTGTSNGVIIFQAKYGISPQSGYVGPKTRTKLNQLYGCSSATTQTQTTQTQTTQTQTTQTQTTQNNCIQNYSRRCSGNYVYYYDSCGNQGSFVQTCSTGCSDGSCTTSTITNTNNCEATCVNQSGAIYPIDCSGNVGQQCSANQICQLTYNTTYSYANGTVQTIKTLTGSQCATPAPVLTTISITPATLSLTVGGTQTLSASVLDQNGNYMYSSNLSWTSNNTSVATVNSYGTVTAMASGTAYITAYSGSMTSNYSVITVSTTPVNTCQAYCTIQQGTNIPVAVACDGKTFNICSSDQVCKLTYDTANTLVNGVAVPTSALSGSQCATALCTPSWQVGSWSVCSNGTQTRSVTDLNNCGVTADKPATSQSCTLAPIVDIKANGSDGPISVSNNTLVTLTWTSANVTSCTASGGWSGAKNTSGTETTSGITAPQTFTITCASASGPISAGVSVNITNNNPAPTVSITANGMSCPEFGCLQNIPMPGNRIALLAWSSANSISCQASCRGSGIDVCTAWSGSKSVSGSETVSLPYRDSDGNILTHFTFYLECSGSGGNAFGSVKIGS